MTPVLQDSGHLPRIIQINFAVAIMASYLVSRVYEYDSEEQAQEYTPKYRRRRSTSGRKKRGRSRRREGVGV